MNVLITGGGGFIGLDLVKALLKREVQVKSLSRNPQPILEELGVQHLVADLRNREAVFEACEGVDAVFHIAAKVGLWGSYRDFYTINVEGTQNIVNACRIQGVKYLIYTSSASVVFDGQSIEGGQETLPYPKRPLSHYTATKAMAEQCIIEANSATLKTLSLRPHIVWGPGDTQIIPEIISRAAKGVLRQIGPNVHRIDTTFVKNYTIAQLAALKQLRRAKINGGEAYFISDGKPILVWDFVNAILQAYNIAPLEKKISKRTAMFSARLLEAVHKFLPARHEPRLTVFTVHELCSSHWFNISKARQELLYQPQIGFKQGLIKLKEECLSAK